LDGDRVTLAGQADPHWVTDADGSWREDHRVEGKATAEAASEFTQDLGIAFECVGVDSRHGASRATCVLFFGYELSGSFE
jgi:hypothetical protein